MKKILKSSNVNFRPLTDSEKLLLVLLGIVLVIYLSNNFILAPQAEKVSSLKAEVSELNN